LIGRWDRLGLAQRFDGVETEGSGLWVLIFDDVEPLQSSSNSVCNSVSDVRILEALKIFLIGEVTADDMDFRSPAAASTTTMYERGSGNPAFRCVRPLPLG
jgi:hypothetical protein